MASNQETLVTVFGGSGFLGRNVVRALAKRDYPHPGGGAAARTGRPSAAARPGRPDPCRAGQPALSGLGQRRRCAIARLAINLVGILTEGGAQSFNAVQARGAETVARAAAAVGARMVHVSAIGADENSLSAYARSKAAGEQAVLAAVPSATILRPSVVFGPEDQFTNRFAALARMSPMLPLDRRRRDQAAAGLCRRCRDRGGGSRRRQDQGGRDLRTRRAGSADHARDHGSHPRHHRTQPHADAAAVRPRQPAGAVAAGSRRAR